MKIIKDMENKNKFYVLTWNFNKDMIEHYDVLPYLRNRLEERIEKSKDDKEYHFPLPKSLDDFKKFVEDESLYQFWSRCEYEMIIHGWPVEKNNYKIDVHEQIMMNIDIVAEMLYEEYWNKDYWEKIDKETHKS